MKNKQISKDRKLWLTFFLGLISATGPLSLDMYLPALPTMQTTFHTQTSVIQMSITFCLIGLAVGQLIVGPLSDHFGRRMPLSIGFAIFALTSVLIMIVHSIVLFLILRFIQGLAGSAGQVLSRAVARDLFSGKELTKFFALLMGVNGVFPIISPIIGGFLLNFMTWRGIFGLLAVIGILVVIGIQLTLKESLPPKLRSTESIFQGFVSMGTMFTKRDFMLIALIQGLVFGALFSYIAASSFVFQNFFHLSAQQFSLLYALNGLGIIIGNNIPAYLTAKLTNFQVLGGALVLGALSAVVMLGSTLTTPNMMLVAVPLFLIVICIGVVNTIATSIAMNSQDKNAGSASAVLGLLMNIVGGIFSPLAGALGAKSYTPMAILIFVSELGGLGLFLVLLKAQKLDKSL
ncbi:multidrug effflux MFS transporter [Pediococcus ethanolidurans]|uniref:multidrug effflux MFS transporter n=1 Tax=Pediococcus ethanolidurans TaxID=319653 RepID=UPI0021E95393|nr:multidrug effflux MFS transporter [Pediococcus ethanolidurans]MCV3316000.1 multidrug effflux MFS transporter [Pediococcus ethanolidurans]MCV3321823.1 multidrug effflux MFS transporter [Pediococcus ethanolidurans]MCV3323164.1 multidrug effflux MFS transporter [Pediococcus ethanolidurans]MCV3327138.1 multidrug effflux MFS transporter [Pediococcus ethanolidurans]